LANRSIQAFLAGLRPPALERWEKASGLGDRLAGVFQAGARAWPGVSVDAAVFAASLARSVDPEGDLETAFEGVWTEDLFLACACLEGHRGALESFDGWLREEVGAAARRMRKDDTFVQEVAQLLRAKLLVPAASKRPKLAEYAARGPLRKWLRAAATRTALNLVDSQGRREDHDAEDVLARMSAGGADPELAHMKRHYGKVFRAVLRDVFAALSPRERNVLRLHLLEGMSLEDVGRAYGAHRATVARWIAAARSQIVEATRERLRTRFQLETAELESLMGLVRSDLDQSLRKYFQKSQS
jgi:RNA polymerase sigma-70 factor (ECF subfamily)